MKQCAVQSRRDCYRIVTTLVWQLLVILFSIILALFFLQLKERDARGYTPFMTAILCHNFKAAEFILDFVESNRGTVDVMFQQSRNFTTRKMLFSQFYPFHPIE